MFSSQPCFHPFYRSIHTSKDFFTEKCLPLVTKQNNSTTKKLIVVLYKTKLIFSHIKGCRTKPPPSWTGVHYAQNHARLRLPYTCKFVLVPISVAKAMSPPQKGIQMSKIRCIAQAQYSAIKSVLHTSKLWLTTI